MGYPSSSQKPTGMLAHSVLLFSPRQQQVVGLIEQKRWVRDIRDYGKKKYRHSRAYEEKESHKWEAASRAMAARLGPIWRRSLASVIVNRMSLNT
ncbi:hypothetical protein XNA1_3090020 [Xenorhabdus nematophila str. Anatoliense]|nr:hypothetical protein XNA1_3090020 [Xenorhabdus nematophila str. Anatoliense]